MPYPAPMPTAVIEPAFMQQPAPQLPDPKSIEDQKQNYSKGLDQQLDHYKATLLHQQQQQAEMIRAQAEQLKKQMAMQIDMDAKQREAALMQATSEQMMSLQHQA